MAVLGFLALPVVSGCKEEPRDNMVVVGNYRAVVPPGWTAMLNAQDAKGDVVTFTNDKDPDTLSCSLTVVHGKLEASVVLDALKKQFHGDQATPWTARTSLGRCEGERFTAHPENYSGRVPPSAAVCTVKDEEKLVAFVSITVALPGNAQAPDTIAPSGCEAILATVRNRSRP